MIKEMYERGISFRYREGIGDRSENRPKIYSLPQSPFQIQAKTKKSKLDPFKPYLQKRIFCICQ
ncbi:MAG: hypothetical protein BAA00_22245 [Parageobacillus thermoglucosidasius]|jgi:hypothetical protein|nr:MAG: hypothetical protein BAA00_22245 [Parageobacillus thermoglucosidasius]